jgi:DNA-binding MarR family transcriptional regulator
MESDSYKELKLFEAIEETSEIKQVDLANRIGIAVGSVNWLLKRLVEKGYVKIKRINRWNWQYILTPKGINEKTRLTLEYVKFSMSLYRDIRKKTKGFLEEIVDKGYDEVLIVGDEGDISDVCYLTCLEMGVTTAGESEDADIPRIVIEGFKVSLVMPGGKR